MRANANKSAGGLCCLLLSLVLGLGAAAWAAAPSDERERLLAYQYLNQLRQRVGLPPLTRDAALERAAAGHARYMSQHRTLTHRERRGLDGFTGAVVAERALAAGYPHSDVSENVARRRGGAMASIDGLMAAIYHRFGFLDLAISEVGVGLAQPAPDQPSYFAYLMGNGAVTALCQGASSAAGGEYYDDLCRDRRRVSRAAWDEARAGVLRQRPELVIWPGRGERDVPPAFYNEVPDPLPDYEVSGYPVSVEFNPVYFADVSVTRFVLRDGRSGQPLPVAALMDRGSDPNGKFTSHQFALFPRDRLEWAHPYSVEVVYRNRGLEEKLEWTFTTREPPGPMIRLGRSGAQYALAPGQQTAFYWAPTAERPILKDPRWTFPRHMTVAFKWHDRNTVLISVQGKAGDRAHVAFAQGYGFDVVVAGPAQAATGKGGGAGAASATGASAGATAGNVVTGASERFKLRSGGTYRFSVQPSAGQPQLGKVRYRYTQGMKVAVTRIGDHDIEVRVVGKPGDQVIFDLGGRRGFSIVVGP